jgi:type I restriction enzyme, S subunit
VIKWEIVKLVDICDVNMGQSPESSSYNQVGDGIPFYQGNADFGYINPETRYYCNKPTKVAKKNDILISVRAPIGALNIATETCCIGRGLAALTAKKHITDTKYLYYILKMKNAELNQKGTGSTFKAINKQNLSEILCPLPPLETQKRIVKRLDTAAELLAMRKQQLVELDNLLIATFYEMFGEPFRNDNEWDRVVLGNCLEVYPQNGLYKHHSKYGSGTKIVRIDSFYDGYVENITSLKRLNLEPEEIKQYALNKDDILINRVNSIEYLGKVGIVPDISEDIVYESNMMKFRLNQEYLIPVFLMYLWRTQFIKAQIRGRAKNAVNQSSVNQQDVLSFTVMKPPLSLQNQFANIVTKIEEQKAIVKQAIDETQHLFDSLMSEYFE